MHELALMEDLVSAVTEAIPTERVVVVRLEVGRLACASVEALKFCFEVCTSGTRLEGAALDVVETSGDELRLREVEVI